MSVLSERLKTIRKHRKVTQKEIAANAGITEQHYQFYEYGRNAPMPDKLGAMCRFLNVTADYFLGLTDEPKPLQVDMETHIDDHRHHSLPGLPEEQEASDTNVEEMLAEAKENWERVDYARRLVGSKIKGNA